MTWLKGVELEINFSTMSFNWHGNGQSKVGLEKKWFPDFRSYHDIMSNSFQIPFPL